MATLHLVNHPRALAPCLAVAGANDAVLLLEDGVYCATAALAPDRPVHALDPDVRARGLTDRLGAQVRLIDDAGFVELVVDHLPIVTWR